MKDKILNATLLELMQMVNNNEVTKKEIFKTYLENIQLKDKEIGAYISVEENIQDGIPIAIKDNINVVGTKTTCASKILENYESPYNAVIIDKLIDAGFAVNGKVNLDEFAFGSSTEYSAIKQTSNPHNLDHVPGGSSGGSAASVAANLAPCAIGTDTGGSVRQPANYCGVVGLKPSYGTISRYGIVSFGSSLDQAGIITKNVEDAAYLLNVISGDGIKDTTSLKKEELPDFTAKLNDGIKGIKVAVIDQFLQEEMQEEVRQAIDKTISIFKENGTVDRVNVGFGKEAISVYHILSSAEASSNLSRIDGIRYGERIEGDTLEDLYVKTRTEGFGREAKRRIMLGTYVLSAGYYDAYYKKALKVRQLIIKEINNIFEEYDVILMPVTIKTAPKKGYVEANQEETFYSDLYTCLANITGICSISVPVSKDNNNMPIGIQLLCNRYEDDKLLQISNAIFKKFNKNNR